MLVKVDEKKKRNRREMKSGEAVGDDYESFVSSFVRVLRDGIGVGTEVDGVYDYDTIRGEQWAFIDVALQGTAMNL